MSDAVLGVAADLFDVFALRRIVQVREAGVVELQISAAEFAERGDLLGIDGSRSCQNSSRSGYTDLSMAARPPR